MTAPACVLCGNPCEPWHEEEPTGYGHNPEPLAEDGRCCDNCNATKVIPARLGMMVSGSDEG